MVLASEFSDSSSEDSETESSKSGPKTPQPSTLTPARPETGHPTSPSTELPRQKLAVHHQPSLFFSSKPRRARQPAPQPRSGGAGGSSSTAATGPTESAAPAVSSGGGDVGYSGDASDVTPSSAAGAEAAPKVGQNEPPVGWVIDVRPTPLSDIPLLSGRKKKKRKVAGGGLAAVGSAATSTGHKDTVSSAAPDEDISVRDEGPHPDSSAVLEPGMPTDHGGGDGRGRRSAQAISAGQEEAVEAQGAGVGDAATPGRWQASCSNTGRGNVGDGDNEECKRGATNAPGIPENMAGLPKKATSKPRPGVTNSRKSGTTVPPPGTAADAGAVVAASAATTEAGGRSVNTSRVPPKTTVHAGDGSKIESRGDLGMALQTPQLTSAGNSKRTASEAEREQPKGTDKTMRSVDGGRAGTKRIASGKGREEEPKSVKKPKKKKKTKKRGGGDSFSLSAGKRDDIDDIFGSLT